MKSIRNSISTLLILSIVLVSLLVGFLSIYSFYNIKIKNIKHSQSQVLRQVDSEINKLLNKIEVIANYIPSNYQEDNRYILRNLVDMHNDISSILVLNKQGIVENFYSKYNENIYKGFNYSKKEYFSSLKNQKSKWSNVFFSSLNDYPSISYSFKDRDKVFVIFIDLGQLSTFITKFKNSDNSHMIRMIDTNGIMILNPDNEDLVKQRFNIKNSTVFNQMIKNNIEYNLKVFKSATKDFENFGMYTKIRKTNWYILIRQSYDLVLDNIYEISYLIFLCVILFILLALYVTFLFTKKVFYELDILKHNAIAFAKDEKVNDYKPIFFEIELLNESFKKMRKDIKKREDGIKKSRDNFEFLLNSTMEAIFLLENGKFIDANKVALKMFGISSKKELINQNFLDYVHEDSKSLVNQNLKYEVEPYEFFFKNKYGQKREALGNGKFITLDGRKVRISTFIDITENKQKDKLLYQQTKMASMGEMIGNIAHQWRQPLSSISTAASGIKVEKEFGILTDERINQGIDLIMENTKFLSKTIDDFRNFFKQDKNLDIINSQEVVEETLKLLESSFKNHSIKIIKNLKVAYFNGYKNELKQALMNIINNSKDALKESIIDEKLIIVKSFTKDERVYICIEDNAGGIDEEIITKVFEPYFTTKHKQQGTGIGLYMTHQIICDHMNGEIDVQNIYEKSNKIGCKFTISFNILDYT